MEAKKEFEKTLQIEPDDADVVVELKNIEETLSVRE